MSLDGKHIQSHINYLYTSLLLLRTKKKFWNYEKLSSNPDETNLLRCWRCKRHTQDMATRKAFTHQSLVLTVE